MTGMVLIKGGAEDEGATEVEKPSIAGTRPTTAQKRYLKMGLDQAGGKLPLFDDKGQEIKPATIRSCIEKGWAEPWFNNAIKPDWLVCKLTEEGRKAAIG